MTTTLAVDDPRLGLEDALTSVEELEWVRTRLLAEASETVDPSALRELVAYAVDVIDSLDNLRGAVDRYLRETVR